jgi:murein DD-endopeptidase MepM/ murein hydrolase activator NlpD
VEALENCARSKDFDPRGFADADTCTRFVDALHSRLGIDASFGGYLEDRSFLWQGTYLGGSGHELHLGIDCNVPADCPVSVPFNGVVLACDDDTPEPWGWGPRVFIETLEPDAAGVHRYVYAFAHLAEISVHPGHILAPNTTIAVVGAAPTNGGWFPHLHVQKMRGQVYDHYRSIGIEKLDGYGATHAIEQNMRDFPDPFSFLASRNQLSL